MVMLFVVGTLVVVLEAVTLTPVHHRVIESMNRELQHEIEVGHVDPATLTTDHHVLTEYEIDANDATFFWKSVAIGLFILLLVKLTVMVVRAQRLRRRKANESIQPIGDRKHLFEKRQSIYHVLSQHLDYILNGNLKVQHVMTGDVRSVRPSAKVSEIRETIRSLDLHHLLVKDSNEKLVGVITMGDLERAEGGRAKEIMTPNPITVEAEADLIPTITYMLEQRIDCVPVVADGRLMGIVTKTDILICLQAILQVFEQSDALARIRQTVPV